MGNMVRWRGVYYICFVDGTGHGTEDSQIRVCASTDLINWTSQIVIEKKTIDPNLLPVGDKLLLYGVKEYESTEDSDFGFPSQQVVTWTEDGSTWAVPKRCFLRNHDFWHPTEFGGRYYVACDTTGHAPPGNDNSVDLLTSEDGEGWEWVTEIAHGSNEPVYYDTTGIHFGTPSPSETSLCFFDDGRLLTITRARGHCVLLMTNGNAIFPASLVATDPLSPELARVLSSPAEVSPMKVFAPQKIGSTIHLANTTRPNSELESSYMKIAISVCTRYFQVAETPATVGFSLSATTKRLSHIIRPTNIHRGITGVPTFILRLCH